MVHARLVETVGWVVVSVFLAPLPGQGGGHPHVAPEASGVDIRLPAGNGISPHLNKADGNWNMGEGFPVDTGGALSRLQGVNVTTNEILPLRTPAWQSDAMFSSLDTYVGRLRRWTPIPADEIEASFEIVIPANYPQAGREKIVLLLSTPETFSSEIPSQQPYGPHDYPGDPNFYGLRKQLPNGQPARVWPGADYVINRYEASPTGSYTVAAAYIVYRTSHRPLFHAVQRLRQLNAAVAEVLKQRYGTPRDIVTIVAGSSAGGLVAQACVIMHPDEFHSAFCSAYSASHRSVPNDQDSFVFFTSLLGMGVSGAGYNLRSAADWTIYCAQEETDYASLSFVNRQRLNQIQRPCYFIVGDEDPVTHGNDWLNALSGNTGVSVPHFGSVLVTNPAPAFSHYWSLASKRCHGGDMGGDPFTIPSNPPSPGHRLAEDAVMYMLDVTHGQRGVVRTAVGTSPSFPRKSGVALNTLEPHDVALSRPPGRQGTGGSLLSPDPTFRRYGSGTWLGVA